MTTTRLAPTFLPRGSFPPRGPKPCAAASCCDACAERDAVAAGGGGLVIDHPPIPPSDFAASDGWTLGIGVPGPPPAPVTDPMPFVYVEPPPSPHGGAVGGVDDDGDRPWWPTHLRPGVKIAIGVGAGAVAVVGGIVAVMRARRRRR